MSNLDDAYRAVHGRDAFIRFRLDLITQCAGMDLEDMGFTNLQSEYNALRGGLPKRDGAGCFTTEDLYLAANGAEALAELRAALRTAAAALSSR